MLLIDKYAYINRLRNCNPKLKILFASLGIFIPRLVNKDYLYLGAILIMFILVVGVAKVPFKNYLKIFFIPAAFLIISLITIMISVNDCDYIFKIKVNNFFIGITKDSLVKGVNLFVTVLSSLTSVYFLILTTPIDDIIKALKSFKLPILFIELMVLIYRSIFIFLEEANNMYLAQKMKFGYENKRNSLKSLALLIRYLFIRVFIKHKQMSIALDCKLFDGDFKLGD